MKSNLLLFFACAILTCAGCNQKPETLVEGGYDQQEMDEAIARARSETDNFLQELASGNGTDFAVKAPIEDNGATEHFWLIDIVYKDGVFEGSIGDEPGVVKNVEYGQKWTIKKSEISDWMFMRDGKIHGNYTMRPLLKTLPDDEAETLRSMLADP